VSSPLTLLIINWNARRHLEGCLQAAVPTGFPVVVVDNASEDGSAAWVGTAYPEVTLLASATNLGFAGGVNAGVAATRTPWVLILNPDVRVSAASVQALLSGASAAADIGAAGACLTDLDGTPQQGFAVRRFPTLASLAMDLLLVDTIWPANPATRHYLARDLPLDRDHDVEQPAAACLLVRRTAFDAIHGLDTRFHPAWWEDVDFCRRLHAAGWRIRYVADARMAHAGGVSVQALGRGPFTRIWYANMRRYVDRHMAPGAQLAFRALLLAGMLLRAAISVARLRADDAQMYLSVVPLAARRSPASRDT
jgi:N-acetylglucosaminyl-diphospho-decaprenol L-rhamnosyltransferase